MPAKAKLQSEMTQNTTNSYIQVVGGFLLQHLTENPQDAEKILTADKTIGKSLKEMENAARKKKVDNCALLTDQEGFAIVLKYFGITTAPTTARAAAPIADNLDQPIAAPTKTETCFNVNLEDLF